jgi:alkanesulfonate monooxygenase SsuD/methylene tetrahydromethanopterin reductase-like flavin-dependent oxidoreductase (luciferase family)
MFRLAGELCDGLCGHPIASVPFIQNVAWPEIDIGLKRADRTRDSFDHQTWVNCAISNDRNEALRELKYHAGRFLATRSYSMVLDSLGLQKDRIAIQEAFFGKPGDSEALIAAVTDEVALAHGVAGTPDEAREQAKRYTGVVDMPVFYSASALMHRDRVRENIKNMIETFGQ